MLKTTQPKANPRINGLKARTRVSDGLQPKSREEERWTIQGFVRWDDVNESIPDVTVKLYPCGSEIGEPLGAGQTDKEGRFVIEFNPNAEIERYLRDFEAYFIVTNRKNQILHSTQESPLRLIRGKVEVTLQVPANARKLTDLRQKRERPQLQVGPLRMDAEQVSKVTPEDVFNVVRALRRQPTSDRALKRIAALSPDLIPEQLTKRTLSATPILEALEALIKLKKWPRDVSLEIERILQGKGLGFVAQVYNTPNFTITYYDAGADAVNPDISAQAVNEPGSDPPVVIDTLPAGAPPTYVKRVGYWLEKALNIYLSPPFSMNNPAAGGRIPVYVEDYGFGGATPSAFYIDNDLPADIVCAVAVHELFHMVQYQYPGNGPWKWSIMEGGAVVAEDAVADLMNRYLDEAGVNFNGTGTQVNTNLSLISASYKSCLFWRYMAEQQSWDTTEPLIGVETYRNVIEHCSAGSWATDDIKAAVRELPWYQDFYEFAYLDASKQDRTCSETLFGNYALACYLKDLGVNLPDRRFDFMEDEEEIRIDNILLAVLPAPQQTALAAVTLSGSGTVAPNASAVFNSSVNSFASRYYEVAIDPAVTNVDVHFKASSGLSSSIFQIALIDEDGQVRDIHRTDLSIYTKRITNLRDGKRLSKLGLVVSGADSSGNFSLNIAAAAPAPDVMITRWHSALKTEYEIDPFGWSWTWVSPDVWVDNNNDGMADGEVYFDFDNKLHVRLHNKGNAAAVGIQVELHYQDASGGLSPTAWLPVQNKAGITQTINILSLAAGASQDWTVNWSPSPSGASQHFCVRAVVTVPGDPNTDNKRLVSNFGKVKVKSGSFIDIGLIRRHLYQIPKWVTLRVVPRLTPDFQVSLHDLNEIETILLQPDEVVHDLLRIEHRVVREHPIRNGDEMHKPFGFAPIKQLKKRPDPRSFYKTDPRALPPGVADQPLLTVVYEVAGHPLGGVTFLVELDKSD